MAKSRSGFDQRVEYGLQVEGRTTDQFEHVGSGDLLLQRFAQLIGAVPQLVQQPGVLDCDDGLGSEARHQRDLLVSEGPNLLSIDGDCAEQLTLLEHRHNEICACSSKLKGGGAHGKKGRLRLDVSNVYRLLRFE